tara:strand:- start:302 stop:637 length:336 start_codon:yes stop_codon:yes gene_type:complete
MKNIKLLLIIAIGLISCKKEDCSTCEYVITNTYSAEGQESYIIGTETGVYSQELQGDCEKPLDEFEIDIRTEMDDIIGWNNDLNPRIDELAAFTGGIVTHEETMTYTIDCK